MRGYSTYKNIFYTSKKQTAFYKENKIYTNSALTVRYRLRETFCFDKMEISLVAHSGIEPLFIA